MIDNKRLKEFVDNIPTNAIWGIVKDGKSYRVPVHEILATLLRSRQLIGRLVEDNEFLYSAFLNGNVFIDVSKHIALMEEVKKWRS